MSINNENVSHILAASRLAFINQQNQHPHK